jgi:hypothetical protein
MIFPSPTDATAELRERLQGPLFGGYSFSEPALERALTSASADAERALRAFLEPVEVLPDDGDTATRDALDAAGTRWVEDPGYDMEAKFFQGERWGFLRLRQRPVVSVTSIRFVYPQPFSLLWDVPRDWIRLDKAAGDVQLVPGTGAFTAPMQGFVMSMLAGGRTIPRMIQVRYRAGIANAARDWPDLVETVLLMAQLRLLKGLMLPGSGSVSADGLSQSQNVSIGDYQSDIDARIERLRQQIHGVQMIVV